MATNQIPLNNLNLNITTMTIIGIVIAKCSPRLLGMKRKNGESRGVTTFTLRDSKVDTINCTIWGSEYFVNNLYERILIGDVVQICSPKLNVKEGPNEIYRPQVSSPFTLTVNEGQSEIYPYAGDITPYLPLLHIPSKLSAGYHGLAEILKFPEGGQNVYVDLLVVVKSIKPAKTIKTKSGEDMNVRTVEVMDNTTPVTLNLDMFDLGSIQRAEEWQPLESVLFVADARVSWRSRGPNLLITGRSVITHQPRICDAETLRLYARTQAERGGEVAAWSDWSGERACSATVAQIRDRLSNGLPFCASLHALLTHLDLDDLIPKYGTADVEPADLRVRFSDHSGELNARLPAHVLAQTFGHSVLLAQLRAMRDHELGALRWRLLLEQCYAKVAVSPTGLLVLALRRASAADPIPLY